MRNQQKNQSRLFVFVFITLLFISCDSNQICYDLKKQMVFSKDNAMLNRLSIDDVKGDLIWITKKEGKKANEYFSFEKMDTLNYIYEKSGYVLKETIDFYLKPNTTYEVENHSIGDATRGKLILKTNATGKVIYTNEVCD